MGIVVLRSMTPWVAVSSLRSSNLLTVISMVPVGLAFDDSLGRGELAEKFKLADCNFHGTRRGGHVNRHNRVSRQNRCYWCSLVISKQKARKPAVTVGGSEKWKTKRSSRFAFVYRSGVHV